MIWQFGRKGNKQQCFCGLQIRYVGSPGCLAEHPGQQDGEGGENGATGSANETAEGSNPSENFEYDPYGYDSFSGGTTEDGKPGLALGDGGPTGAKPGGKNLQNGPVPKLGKLKPAVKGKGVYSQTRIRPYIGNGVVISGGIGLFAQGFEVSFGIVGNGLPYNFGQLFVTFGVPTTPAYFNASFSTQYISVRSPSPIDVSGEGRTWALGYGVWGGSYSKGINRAGQVTSRAFSTGPSWGAKYTGGYTKSATAAVPIWMPFFMGAFVP